jgi:small conductance mechanosensitive channel
MPAIVAPQNLDAFAAMVWTWSVAFMPRLVAAVALLFAGVLVARWASGLTTRIAERTGRVDPTLEPIIASSARYGVLILVVIAALSQLGVQTASVLAVLGAAGLAVGLALQGTLSNIAAGIMLLWLRPFKVGDYIEVLSGNPIAGSVKEIGLFACLVESYDGAVVFAPNSTIWNFALRNHDSGAGRLVTLSVRLSQKADLRQAKGILLEMMSGDSRVLKAPAPDVFVDLLDDGGFSLTCRLWTAAAHIDDVQRSMIAQAQHSLETSAAPSPGPRDIARAVPADSHPSKQTTRELREPAG